ncbi:MAG: rhomboid family intramembrane serine protease [Chitinophagaceae bacterium]|nr:rhomboid family intramembrane serine protease [Chitinophagaceae bacterium]
MTYNNYRPSQTPIPAVINLIIINFLVFLCQYLFDGRLFITQRFALYGLADSHFKPYQLITHMFMHGGWAHLLFNMYALWLFGSMLERNWGSKRFIIFYLLSGLGAAFAQILLMPDSVAVGASGAIMGLLAAFAYTYPNVQFFIIPFPFAIKAKWIVVVYVLIDLFGGVSTIRSATGGDGIAHFAHLGGLVTGFLLMIFWISKLNKRY